MSNFQFGLFYFFLVIFGSTVAINCIDGRFEYSSDDHADASVTTPPPGSDGGVRIEPVGPCRDLPDSDKTVCLGADGGIIESP